MLVASCLSLLSPAVKVAANLFPSPRSGLFVAGNPCSGFEQPDLLRSVQGVPVQTVLARELPRRVLGFQVPLREQIPDLVWNCLEPRLTMRTFNNLNSA